MPTVTTCSSKACFHLSDTHSSSPRTGPCPRALSPGPCTKISLGTTDHRPQLSRLQETISHWVGLQPSQVPRGEPPEAPDIQTTCACTVLLSQRPEALYADAAPTPRPGFDSVHSPLRPEGHTMLSDWGPGVVRRPEGGAAFSPSCPSSLKSQGVTLRPETEGTASASKTISPSSQLSSGPRL